MTQSSISSNSTEKPSMLRRIGRLSFSLTGVLALMGCSGPDIIDLFIPRTGYTVHKDIAYGDQPRQQLDIYVPDQVRMPSVSPVPVIVFFYGGSWKKGSKNDYRFVGQAFASKGYITVVADYRLYPHAYFPDFVEDGANAVAWVHEHIGQYGGDSNNVFLAGHSAGAYIAAMLTINDRYINAAGGERSWIRGAIGIAGPYDFLPFTPDISDIFSKAKDTDTQPITFVGPHVPPMLLLTGDEDEDVRPKNSINLAKKLRDNHDTVTVQTYQGVAHIGIVLSLAQGFRGKAPVLEDIDHFVHDNAVKPSVD